MLTRIVFILTLFASAFLSFSIQPLLGKMMLPIVGGAPAGWIVAMAFFQMALLGGYALSHLLQRVTPLQHGLALLALYLIGLAFLPSHIATDIDFTQHVSLVVLLILAKTILIPFIALTATTSALLRIFSHTDEPTAKDPYYLFIASNAGSFIGLFIYPLVLEPFFDLSSLSHLWFFLYGGAIAFVALSLILARHNPDTRDHAVDHRTNLHISVNAKTIVSWIALAFVPCCLSMSLTTMLSTDLGNIPLIWTLPLGLYLFSFVAAFARKPWLQLDTLNFLHLMAATLIFVIIFMNTLMHTQSITSLITDTATLLVLFFIICWSCHQTLAAQRPAAQNLTFYYLMIAVGGALAGILNAFIIPVTLNSVIEFPLSVGLSLCLPMIWNKRILSGRLRYENMLFGALVLIAIIVLSGCIYSYKIQGATRQLSEIAARCIFLLCILSLLLKPRFLVVLTIPVAIYYMSTTAIGTILDRERNFFGSMMVVENIAPDGYLRTLRHGNTTHGMALYDAEEKPTMNINIGYYRQGGPITDAYNLAQPKETAILGLGTGQLACFSKKAQVTYFEIDPDVVTVAQNDFPYLAKCPPKAIVLGDARLEFAKQTTPYDLLILDVFSSDGIPTHIVTIDAVREYLKHMTKDGVLLFHVSNRYLSLSPQVGATAHEIGLPSYMKLDNPDRVAKPYLLPSMWVAVPLNKAKGAQLLNKGWIETRPGNTQIWTDQRSSVLTAIRPIANKISGQDDLVK